jgi:hypothetical protein
MLKYTKGAEVMSTDPETIYRAAEGTILKRIARGWLTEAVGAFVTIGVAIIGLAGVLSTTMAAIATIILGATFLIEGGAFAGSFTEFVARNRAEGQDLEWGGIIASNFLAGMVGVIVGTLLLLGIAAPILQPIAVLVFGARFLFGCIVSFEAGSQELVGVGAFVLGLLAVSGLYPLTLVLIALLSLGAFGVFIGAETGSKLLASARESP